MRIAHATVGLALGLASPFARANVPQRLAIGLPAPSAATSLSVFPEGVLFADAPSSRTGEGDDGTPPGAPGLDFDLLGEPDPEPTRGNPGALRLRRRMLVTHQGMGFGLAALVLATTVVGQLNYSDRFASGPDTGRYRLTHKALAYSTAGTFAATGLAALLAPTAGRGPYRLDRVMLHRIAMTAAALGMAAQAVLGIRTRDRTGYLDQDRYARAHLAVGYATLALFAVGIGVLVF